MSKKEKESGSLKAFIKNTSGSLVLSFMSGILIWGVYGHFIFDGMLPGAGGQGDIAGMMAPVFVVLSASILAYSPIEEFSTWKAIVFHVLYELGIIIIHFLLVFLAFGIKDPSYQTLYHTFAWWWSDLGGLLLVLFLTSAMCYLILRFMTAGDASPRAYIIVTIVLTVLMYIPFIALF